MIFHAHCFCSGISWTSVTLLSLSLSPADSRARGGDQGPHDCGPRSHKDRWGVGSDREGAAGTYLLYWAGANKQQQRWTCVRRRSTCVPSACSCHLFTCAWLSCLDLYKHRRWYSSPRWPNIESSEAKRLAKLQMGACRQSDSCSMCPAWLFNNN